MLLQQRKKINSILLVAFAVVAAISVAILPFATSRAQQSTTNSASTLSVSPVRTDIQGEPGTTETVETVVTNVSDETIIVRPVANDFVAGDERGTPALILDADQYAPSHSLKRFMGTFEDVEVAAGESAVVDVVITIPANAEPGGYFGAVRFAPATTDDGGQVNLSASVASIILLTLPGEVPEKLTLTNFDVQQGGNPGSLFFTDEGIDVAFRFESESGIQLAPFGTIAVMKGDEVVSETDFNQEAPRDSILPDSARRWEVPLEGIDGFGHYTVLSTFTYGSKNETIQAEQSFWVIPWLYIIGAAVALLVLIGGIILTIWLLVRRKRYATTSYSRGGRGGGYRR